MGSHALIAQSGVNNRILYYFASMLHEIVGIIKMCQTVGRQAQRFGQKADNAVAEGLNLSKVSF